MSGSWISAVLIVPVAHQDVFNKAFVAMGEANQGVVSYGEPLSASGAAPATHYGGHTWVPDAWLAKMQAAQTGALPGAGGIWASQGISPTQVRAAMAAMTLSWRLDGQHEGHFDAVVAGMGLKRIPGPRPGSA